VVGRNVGQRLVVSGQFFRGAALAAPLCFWERLWIRVNEGNRDVTSTIKGRTNSGRETRCSEERPGGDLVPVLSREFA